MGLINSESSLLQNAASAFYQWFSCMQLKKGHIDFTVCIASSQAGELLASPESYCTS